MFCIFWVRQKIKCVLGFLSATENRVFCDFWVHNKKLSEFCDFLVTENWVLCVFWVHYRKLSAFCDFFIETKLSVLFLSARLITEWVLWFLSDIIEWILHFLSAIENWVRFANFECKTNLSVLWFLSMRQKIECILGFLSARQKIECSAISECKTENWVRSEIFECSKESIMYCNFLSATENGVCSGIFWVRWLSAFCNFWVRQKIEFSTILSASHVKIECAN